MEHLTDNACTHCASPLIAKIPLFTEGKSLYFCCHGCKNVYQILSENNLTDYYEIKRNGPKFSKDEAITSSDDQYDYLDFTDFRQQFMQINSDQTISMLFYLEGIHCTACLWLLEKLPLIEADVIKLDYSMSTQCALVLLKQNGSFAKVARRLALLGYKPHPIKNLEEVEKKEKEENRRWLYKIGIAGFATGNIMLFAAGIYAGATGPFAKLFDFLSLLFILPVILYSATPFYSQALGALTMRTINIDQPIALAIILGFGASLYNLLNGSTHLYFDSISALTFLILSARYVLKRIESRGRLLNTNSIYLGSGPAILMQDGKEISILPEMIKPLHQILVPTGKSVCADGRLLSESAYLDLSLLTGESKMIKYFKGSEIVSGAINLGAPFVFEVTRIGNETMLGRILDKLKKGEISKATITKNLDTLARYFLAVLFIVAAVVLPIFLHYLPPFAAFERVLALLIVTCPCAIALASPLALSESLRLGTRLGLLIKDDSVFERVTKIKNLFFDKTGTLTYGKFKLIEIIEKEKVPHAGEYLASIESLSTHPLARSIVQSLEERGTLPCFKIEDFRENVGRGVSGYIENKKVEVKGSSPHPFLKRVEMLVDDRVVLELTLSDALREEGPRCLKELSKFSKNIYILTGDTPLIAKAIARELNVPDEFVMAEATPERKQEIITKSELPMMVGDGANDALALKSSLVGVAVSGTLHAGLLSSDLYMTTQGLTPLIKLFTLSHETMKLIKRNLVFSIFYNIIGGYLAITGLASPLFAAILMPVSSLTVLFSTIVGTSELRKLKKEVATWTS